MREIGDVLKAPWEYLAHQATGSSDVRQTSIERVEDLGSAEERVRTDYVGRYAIELLQNAHDACADAGISGQVWFQVTDKELLVANEGAVFDADRIASLIRLGASTKQLGGPVRHTIGYKGIGFTSVFEISDRPQIITKDVRFGFDRERATEKVVQQLKIEPKVVPARAFPFVLEAGELGAAEDTVRRLLEVGAVTVIRLPFRAGIDVDDVLDNLRENLVPEVLLFAPSIKALSIVSKDSETTWHHRPLAPVGAGRVHKLTSDHGESRRWLVATEQIDFPSELADDIREEIWNSVESLQIAVAIPWLRNRPDPSRGPQPLHVYFPTEDRLDKAVLIHGDFYVDSSRRRIEDQGAGGKISELVGKSASRLLAKLAESIGDRGHPLLRCLSGSGEQSGYGYALGGWIDQALSDARIARPADGSAPVRASDLNRLGTGLGPEREKQFAELIDERSSILMPGDDEGVEELLEELECWYCEPEWIVSHLSPGELSFSYDRYADMLGNWVGRHQYGSQVVPRLKRRPIVQTENGEWKQPDKVFIKHRSPIKLPASAGLHPAKVPRREQGRKLLELLGVKELEPWRALEMVLGLGADTEEKRSEFLEFYKALWLAAPSAFDDQLKLESIQVPVRTAPGAGSNNSWRKSGSVYFPEAWTGNDLLEVLYGWNGEAEFLADEPPVSSTQCSKMKNFYQRIGVAPVPRIESDTRRKFFLDCPEFETIIRRNNPCPDTHPISRRTVEVKLLDRLELILEKQDAATSVRLAEYLASQDHPYGPSSRVTCSHSSHSLKHGKKIVGFQQWLLESESWVPVSENGGQTIFVEPSGAWFGEAPSEGELRLPIAQLPEKVAEKLHLVSATSPSVSAVERLLAQFHAENPELASASEVTLATCRFLLNCLPGAAKRLSAGDAKPQDVHLPSLSEGKWVWSSSPLVPDLPGLDRLPGVECLPPGDWDAVQERYGLKRASRVVVVRPLPSRERPRWLLTKETRRALVALAVQHGIDLKRAAVRIGRLKERASESLQLRLRHIEEEAKVDQDHYLEFRFDSAGHQIGGVLYLASIEGENVKLFRVARRIALYVGAAELGSSFANFLLVGRDLLQDNGVGEPELARAEDALRKWTTEDQEPELRPEPVSRSDQAVDAEGKKSAEESGVDGGSTQGPGVTSPEPAAGREDPAAGVEDDRASAVASPGRSETGGSGSARSPWQAGTSGAGRSGPHFGGESSRDTRRKVEGARSRRQHQGSYVTYVGPSSSVAGASTQSESKNQTDRSGVNRVLEFERNNNRFPVEMPHKNPGYDIESKDDTGEIVRFIEVKSTDGLWGGRGVALTKAQYQFSRHPDIHGKFWLYVVERAREPDARVYRIYDPVQLIDKYVFDRGWRGLAEQGPEELEVPSLERELELADPRIHSLVRSAVEAGACCPEIGYELLAPERWPIEAAWPIEKVAILTDHDEAREDWLQSDGWVFKDVSDWSDGELTAVILARR